VSQKLSHVAREGPRQRFRVGIMGASLYTGNRGVSALSASIARLVWRSRPDATVSLLIGNRDARSAELIVDGQVHAVATVNYRLSPRAALGSSCGGSCSCRCSTDRAVGGVPEMGHHQQRVDSISSRG